MNLHAIFIIIFLCAASVSCSQSDLAVIKPSSNNSVILSEIIANYLKKYFRDAEIFVSIILSTSEKNQHFLDDFFIHFFNDPRMKMFSFNILDKLDRIIHENRHAFNIIFANDADSLQ